MKSDDVLADVETDKATMEVVGYADGTLLYVGVKEGDAAKVNEIIAIVGKEGEEYKNLLDAVHQHLRQLLQQLPHSTGCCTCCSSGTSPSCRTNRYS